MEKIPTSQCKNCGEVKNIHEFAIRMPSGKIPSRCKICDKEYRLKHMSECDKISQNSAIATSHFCNRKNVKHKDAPRNRQGTAADGTHFTF
jgi:tRNA U34 2-thiouridine synthase MnmA/TrmU